MKTDFEKYEKMPLISLKKTKNNWFHSYIKTLPDLDIEENYVVLLNVENSNIIEKEIKKNESYNAYFTNKIYKYYCLINNGSFPKTGEVAKEPVTDLIRMIDLENNTNIWRYKKNRDYLKNMVDFIIDEKNYFWELLNIGDTALVDELKKASKATTDGPKSLASKVCKYFSILFYHKDNYYINDSVVRNVLPYYLNFYGISPKKDTKTYFNNLSYQDLHFYLGKIRIEVCPDLSRTKIDHIMWYCYRFETIEEDK